MGYVDQWGNWQNEGDELTDAQKAGIAAVAAGQQGNPNIGSDIPGAPDYNPNTPPTPFEPTVESPLPPGVTGIAPNPGYVVTPTGTKYDPESYARVLGQTPGQLRMPGYKPVDFPKLPGNYKDLSAKEQFQIAKDNGMIPESAEFIPGKGNSDWSHLKKTEYAAGKEVARTDYKELKEKSPDLYRILTTKGVEAYNTEVERLNTEAKKQKQAAEDWKQGKTQLPDGVWMTDDNIGLVKERTPDLYKVLKEKGYQAYTEAFDAEYHKTVIKQEKFTQTEANMAKMAGPMGKIIKTQNGEIAVPMGGTAKDIINLPQGLSEIGGNVKGDIGKWSTVYLPEKVRASGQAVLEGITDTALGVLTLPAVGFSVLAQVGTGRPKEAGTQLVETGKGMAKWIGDTLNNVKDNPAAGIPYAIVTLGPMLAEGAVLGGKLVKGAAVKLHPEGIPARALAIEPDVSRIPYDAAGYEPVRLAIGKALEKQLEAGKDAPYRQRITIDFPDRTLELSATLVEKMYKVETPLVKPFNLADAVNIPERLAPKLENYIRDNDGRVGGSFINWLHDAALERPHDVDLGFKNPARAIKDIIQLAEDEGLKARKVEHGVEVYSDGAWRKIGDIGTLKHLNEDYLPRGFKPNAPTVVNGVKIDTIGTQFAKESRAVLTEPKPLDELRSFKHYPRIKPLAEHIADYLGDPELTWRVKGQVEVDFRITPMQKRLPDTVYSATPDLTGFLKELREKGYITVKKGDIYTSPQLAADFLRRSGSGTPPVDPGVIAIRINPKTIGDAFRLPEKEYKGAIEAEVVGQEGVKVRPTAPNLYSKVFGKTKGATAESFTEYLGPTERTPTNEVLKPGYVKVGEEYFRTKEGKQGQAGELVKVSPKKAIEKPNTLKKGVVIRNGQHIPVLWMDGPGTTAGAPNVATLYAATRMAMAETLRDVIHLRPRKIKVSLGFGLNDDIGPFKSSAEAYRDIKVLSENMEEKALKAAKKVVGKRMTEDEVGRAVHTALEEETTGRILKTLSDPAVRRAIARDREVFDQTYELALGKYLYSAGAGNARRPKEEPREESRAAYEYRDGELQPRHSQEEITPPYRRGGIPPERRIEEPSIREPGEGPRVPPEEAPRYPPEEPPRETPMGPPREGTPENPPEMPPESPPETPPNVPPEYPPEPVPEEPPKHGHRPRFPASSAEAKRRQEFGGAITWQQGQLHGCPVYISIKAPYRGAEDVQYFFGAPPPNAQEVRGGPKSAYRSIQTVTGQPPKDLWVDMGAFDVGVRSPDKRPGKAGAIVIRRDTGGLTTGDITIGRSRPRIIKSTTTEHMNITPQIGHSRMPREVAIATGQYTARMVNGKPVIKVKRL